jgi:hypothetical protein
VGFERKNKVELDKPQARFVEPARDVVRRRTSRKPGTPVTQATLQVGPVDDPYEREADAVADAVMRHFTSGPSAVQIDAGAPAQVARTSISKIARSAGPSAAAGAEGGELEAPIESRIQRASGGGSALDDQTRGRFESAMGTDLSPVRIHANSELAPQIGAHAFTHGNDVHFAPGAYDPGSNSGQRLLAHELAHVVQQTGSAQRIQAKLWTAKEFREKTAIKSRMIGNDASTAQDVILALLAEYERVPRSEGPTQRISRILAMQDVAQRWLDHRGEMYADSTNYNLASLEQAKNTYNAAQAGQDGPAPEAPVAANPKAERMAGLQQFVALCKSEIALLSRSARAQGLSDEELAAVAIDESNKSYKKAKQRYPDQSDAKSVFGKVGRLADMAVGAPGSKAELEITADVPVQPGVYVTFGIKGGAERDKEGAVKLRLDVNVGVKGKISGAAELSATLGGFIEAQAQSGVEAATLMSYALYRRGREGSAPTDLVSLLWGGSSGKSGLAKSEDWSRKLEEQVWGKDDTGADVAGADSSYVQSGGTLGAKAALGVEGGPVNGELTGGVFGGTRVDKQSLMDRKGGAGAQNVKSDSVLNAGERQKRVGADVFGWNVGGSVSAGGFKAGLSVSQTGTRRGGGASGKDKVVTMDQVAVEASGSGTMPPNLDLGARIYKLLESIVRAADKAERDNGDANTAAGKQLLKTLAMTTPSVLTPQGGIQVPAAADLKISVTIKAGGSDKSKKPSLEVSVGTEQETALPIPDVIKVKLTKSQAFFIWSSDDGPWVLGE